MRVAVASDHAGVEMKARVVRHLEESDCEPVDLGPQDETPVDYPDMASKACSQVVTGDCQAAILICGTGIGMSIAANKLLGIRAALCRDGFSARMAREHNDANVLVLGSRVTGLGLALDIVDEWLRTEFAGGRHKARVDKIRVLERRSGCE